MSSLEKAFLSHAAKDSTKLDDTDKLTATDSKLVSSPVNVEPG
jgi:hypothetical protein